MVDGGEEGRRLQVILNIYRNCSKYIKQGSVYIILNSLGKLCRCPACHPRRLAVFSCRPILLLLPPRRWLVVVNSSAAGLLPFVSWKLAEMRGAFKRRPGCSEKRTIDGERMDRMERGRMWIVDGGEGATVSSGPGFNLYSQ